MDPTPTQAAPITAPLANDNQPPVTSHHPPKLMRWWEPFAVFWATFLLLAAFASHFSAYLTPKTGDEPFYLMTAISILEDGDLNECNNYRQEDEARLNPTFAVAGERPPAGWKGWRAAPFPLPPHPAIIVPESRSCIDFDYGAGYLRNGPGDELYSKHGLGLTLLILPAFALGGISWVTYFLVLLGALLATNIYLLAREATGLAWPAVLTWGAFALTVPLMPYSYLIFPELPAALLVVYAFRRIREWDNNPLQVVGIAACIAFLPWLHYRFVPVCGALAIYYLYQEWRRPQRRRWSNGVTVLGVTAGSAALLMAFFYHRYAQILPSASDHAGSNDFMGTLRGIAGLLLDEQWGLIISAPVFLLALVGVALMLRERVWRMDLLWVGLVFVPYYLVIANYSQWWGEWCPPARYLASTLPVLSLPFSVALARARSVGYYALYGLLMLVSLGMMAGYLYQPQWMYNQPYKVAGQNRQVVPDDNKVIAVGLTGLLRATPLGDAAPQITASISENLPSFVLPSLYYSQGGEAAEVGVNYFSPPAWRASITPAAISLAIVALGIALAWPPGRKRNALRSSEQREAPPLETYTS